MKDIEYLDEIPWFQDLPDDIADLENAQRFAFQKNQILMSRHGLAPWGFLLNGTAQWILFDPHTSKVKVLADIGSGQFLGSEDLQPGAVAVATSAGEMLFLGRTPDQPPPLRRLRPVSGRRRVPANDLPFHAYHLDHSAPHGFAIDVGAGVGRFSQLLAPYAERFAAIEPDPVMAQMASERMRSLGYVDFSVLTARAEALPCEAGSVDLVGCRLAMHQFQDPAAFAAEASRVLCAGGLLALTDLVAPADQDAARLLNQIERTRDAAHGAIVSKDALLALFRDGFRVVAEFDSVVRTALIPWLQHADTSPSAIAHLLKGLGGSSGFARASLGIAGDPHNPQIGFDSRRYSVILQRTR